MRSCVSACMQRADVADGWRHHMTSFCDSTAHTCARQATLMRVLHAVYRQQGDALGNINIWSRL